MKLYVTLTFACTDENLSLFLQKISEARCLLQSMYYLSSENKNKIYRTEIIYTDRKIFKEKILNWVSAECILIDCSDMSNKGVEGGLLKIHSKIPFESPSEFEGKILGYLEILKDASITQETIQYTGMSQNIGLLLLSGNNNEMQSGEIYQHLLMERDALLLNYCSNYNAQPLILNYKSKEDIIKNISTVAQNYILMRIALSDTLVDETVFERMKEIGKPAIFREYDEIPLYIIIKILNILQRYNLSLSDSVVGLIGITASALRCTSLLNSIGCNKILGYDSNEKNQYNFEKGKGIATNISNVLENSDIVVFISDICSNEDFYMLQRGQVLLINPDIKYDSLILQERRIKSYEFLNIENSYLLLPGLAEAMRNNNIMCYSDELLLAIAKNIAHSVIEIDNAENMFTIKDAIKDV